MAANNYGEIREIKKRLEQIEERNERVEGDKRWETSLARRAVLAVGTYVAVVFFLNAINAPNPYANALIPAGAYLLQTLTLPAIKKKWLEKN